ncbi:tetratricopeptide repeat protein [candidate division FCPU426 bacterium]|nr:tetratricopeptide repeat protein [candidate division FCPU426 bacterium]
MKKDELRDVLNRVVDFSKKNTENIVITAIIAVVVLVLIPLYFSNREQNERRAGTMLTRAISYSMQPVAEGKTDPASGQFRTVEEKYRQAQQTFAEISGTYRNTRMAQIAKVGEANASFYLKEYEKALGLYQEAKLKKADAQMQLTLDERIGACYENMGKWQEALTTYQAILDGHPAYFNRRAVQYHMALCYEQLGQGDQARALLEAVQTEDPDSYWAEIARRHLLIAEKSRK